jgi:hypothetical protein
MSPQSFEQAQGNLSSVWIQSWLPRRRLLADLEARDDLFAERARETLDI